MRHTQSPFDVIMVWFQNDWGLYGRRNEFIARTLLKHKAVRNVLHIEPPIELEQLQSRLRSERLDDNIHTNLKRINLYNDKGVFLYTPHILEAMSRDDQLESLRIQLENVVEICRMDNILLWLYPPHTFAEFMLNIFKERSSLIVSDCVDDHRKYVINENERLIIENRYGRIIGASDLVFSVSKSMRDDMARYNSRSYYIPNAIPAEILDREKAGPVPAGMAGIKPPVIGYTGTLSLRFDAELIGFIAKERPEWNIVLIGTSPNSDVQALFDFPNIHWLGPIRYDKIHDHIAQFDVCMIPHTVDSMTDTMSPLKAYEYLALGKPVVATDVAGVRIFQGDIEIVHSREDFVKAIEFSLTENSPERERRRVNRVRNHTWTDRIDEMMRLSLHVLKTKSISDEAPNGKKYYSFDRPEVCECVPATAKTILDVGCATGRLGAALKKRQDCFVVGVEYEPVVANEAKNLLDDVIIGDIEEKVDTLPSDFFDCIILADVLEHLRNPGEVLEKLGRTLKDTGTIVASIPNVRHWSVILPLLEGEWTYEDAGILDRTHLRFFTKKSALNLLARSGYSVTGLRYTTVGDNSSALQLISKALTIAGVKAGTFAEEANHYQYLVTAQKAALHPKCTSIIIPTYNQLEYTRKCVKSIQKHTPEPHEIIFVDNGSSDGTVQWLRTLVQENSHYSLIENEHNLGFAAGNNQGLEKAKGDYILLLNNDVVVTEAWLKRLLSHFEESIDIGMVGPMSNSVSGPQLVQTVPYNDKDMQAMQAFAQAFMAQNSGKSTPILRLVGFCLLVKREVLDIIGGLDENYINGNFEDDDFCLRSIIAGYKNIIAQDVFIHHYGSMTFKGNAIDYTASMRDNREYFATKWKDLVEVTETGYKVNLTKKQQLKKLIEWGEERFAQGELEGAARIFKRILTLDKTNAEALNNLGVIQWQLGDGEVAMDTFQMALNFNPQDADALANLVQAATETGKLDLIQQDLLAVVKQAQPENPDLVKLINNTKQDSGEHKRKCSKTKTPLSSLEELLKQGEEQFEQGDLESAARIFEKILFLDKTNAEARNNLGVIQWQLGDVQTAMNSFQTALSFNPKDPDALANLAQVAIETEKIDLIKEDLLAVVKQAQPESPDLMKLINAKQDSGCSG